MKVRFIGREKYSTGMTYISEPWRDTPNKDKFIYELRSEKNENLKSYIIDSEKLHDFLLEYEIIKDEEDESNE